MSIDLKDFEMGGYKFTIDNNGSYKYRLMLEGKEITYNIARDINESRELFIITLANYTKKELLQLIKSK